MTNYTDTSNYNIETQLIHSGFAFDEETGVTRPPIYPSTTFKFKSIDHASNLFALKEFGNIYSRLTNPSNSLLGDKLAALEGGAFGIVTASGHAAQLITLLNLLTPGDNIVASRQIYGGSINQFSWTFKRQFGWDVKFVNYNDHKAFVDNIDNKTKAIFIESQSNPLARIADIQAIADIAHNANIPLIVDNTISTPYLIRPIEHGADIVIHSLTKYLVGNATILGGVVIDAGKFDWLANKEKFPLLNEPDASYNNLVFSEAFGNIAFAVRTIAVGLRDLGVILSPFHAFLTQTSIDHLHVRIDRHISNAKKVAEFLSTHSKAYDISYPGLPSDDNYDLAQKYSPKGVNGLFTFRIKNGYEDAVKFVNKLKIFLHVANIGDTRSLVLHPASTSHSQLTKEEKKLAGIEENLIRLSIGLENAEDIISDLKQALD